MIKVFHKLKYAIHLHSRIVRFLLPHNPFNSSGVSLCDTNPDHCFLLNFPLDSVGLSKAPKRTVCGFESQSLQTKYAFFVWESKFGSWISGQVWVKTVCERQMRFPEEILVNPGESLLCAIRPSWPMHSCNAAGHHRQSSGIFRRYTRLSASFQMRKATLLQMSPLCTKTGPEFTSPIQIMMRRWRSKFYILTTTVRTTLCWSLSGGSCWSSSNALQGVLICVATWEWLRRGQISALSWSCTSRALQATSMTSQVSSVSNQTLSTS